MKKILLISFISIITGLFVGCGGGGSDAAFEGTISSSIAIVNCGTSDSTTNTTWTTLQSGDTVSTTTGTELLWKQTTIKQVCVKVTSPTGSAEVN